jgi:hypothetical protein
LAIAVVNEVKTNISLANVKLKHEDELNMKMNMNMKMKPDHHGNFTLIFVAS